MQESSRSKAGRQTTSGHEVSSEVVIGTYLGFDGDGRPLVNWPGNASQFPAAAVTTVDFLPSDLGREVALLFAGSQPVVIGLIRQPLDGVLKATQETDSGKPWREGASVGPDRTEKLPIQAQVDGERVTLKAEREIILECGKSSITLTRSGKIVIRGEYIASRSSGVQRIKGGSVQLN